MTQISTHANYDTAYLRESFKSFIKQTEEFKNYDFDGSGLKEIIRILSYSDQNGALQNQFIFNELNLDSADIYNNVLSLATKQGYVPKSKKCAKVIRSISVKASGINPPEEIILTKDNRFITRTTGNKILTFSPSKEYKATLNTDGYYVFSDVLLYQGVWANQSYSVQTGNSIEAYKISNYNVDTDTLVVAVRDSDSALEYTTYNQFKNAHDLGKNKNIYYLTTKKDGFYYIEFGDNVFSKKLQYQNIVFMSYLITDGQEGNSVIELTAANPIGGFIDITINGNDYSFGGAERESKELIKINAARNVSAKGNCVSDSDYESAITELYPDVVSVRAWGGEKSDPLKYGYTFISAKFNSFDRMSESLKADILSKIKERNIGSITPIIIDPDYTYVNLDIVIRMNKEATLLTKDYLEVKVIDQLKKYSKEQLEFFDSNYDTSNIIEFVKSIDKKAIIGCTVENKFSKLLSVLVNYKGTYEIDFNQNIKPTTVMITGFGVTNTSLGDNTYFIKDNGKGTLQIFSKNSSGLEVIINSNIGEVNYNTGNIALIDFNPNIIYNGQYINVSISPVENSLYLESLNNTIFKIKDITTDTIEVRINA